MWTARIARRTLARIVIAAAVSAAVLVFGVSWYYSNQIESGAFKVDYPDPEMKLEVVAVDDRAITLRDIGGSAFVDEIGLIGVEADGGYGHAGRILDSGDDTVVREFATVAGTVQAGDRARMDRYAFPDNPTRAYGLEYREVTIDGPLGDLAAWFVDGGGSTWAIMVHGRRAARGEALRALRVVADAGIPALVITYRNDPEAPLDPSGYYQFGLTEWQDVHAAAEYALANGARELILVGFSMGGAITTSFILESSLSDQVVATVLDSPMLDLGATVSLAASRRRVPGFVASIAMWLSSRRHDVDWKALDYAGRAGEIDVPTLLFHGDRDSTVPVASSDRFAAMRPDVVTYVRVEGAEHVASWNVDPERYEQELRDFLESTRRKSSGAHTSDQVRR